LGGISRSGGKWGDSRSVLSRYHFASIAFYCIVVIIIIIIITIITITINITIIILGWPTAIA
jgi:hypothetical protein